jgi:hypothetical protein
MGHLVGIATSSNDRNACENPSSDKKNGFIRKVLEKKMYCSKIEKLSLHFLYYEIVCFLVVYSKLYCI